MGPDRNRFSPKIFLISAIIVLLAGCGFRDGDSLEEVVEQTYKVDPTAILSISNSDGSIRVYGTDTAEIELQATKKAYRTDRLHEISVKVSAQPNAVSIKTIYPSKKIWDWGDRSGTVEYTLVVPRTCRISRLDLVNGEILVDGLEGETVHASLVNGRLYAHNCFSDTHLRVITGGLNISYNWWPQRKFSIDAQIVNGHTHVLIPGDASFRVMAETEDGQIDNAFADEEQRNGDDISKIDTAIGTAPKAQFKLRARNGNIEIQEADLEN